MPRIILEQGQVVYHRRDVADLVGISLSRLRVYEREGLVTPTQMANGLTVYDEAQVARLRRIQRLLRHLGLNLAGVDLVLRLTDRVQQLQQEVETLRGRTPPAPSPERGGGGGG